MGYISTQINPAAYGETGVLVDVDKAGGGTVSVVGRPGAPQAVKVRNAQTLADMPDAQMDERGYIASYNTGDVKAVYFSVDNWATPIGPFETDAQIIASLSYTDQAAAVGLAQQAAQQATTQAQAAAAAAAGAIPSGARGTANGVASLDNNAQVPQAQLPGVVQDLIQSYLDQQLGGGLASSRAFVFAGSDYVTNPSKFRYLPEACLIKLGPVASVYPSPGSTDLVYTIETATDPFGTWTDRYGAVKPTIPAGQSKAVSAAPTSQSVAAGTYLRVRPVSLPPGPSGSSTAATQQAVSAVYNSGTGSATSHTGPARPSGTANDTVVMFIAANGANALTLDAAWTVRAANVSSTTTPRAGLWVATAKWSASLAMGITINPGSPLVAVAVLTRDVAYTTGTTPTVDASAPVGSNATSGGFVQTPAGTASGDADLVYKAAAFWYPSGTDNYAITPSAGPTEIADSVTTRAAQTNFGLWVGSQGAVASGGAIAATTLTFAGGTGSVATAGYVTGYITMRRAASTDGPTDLTIEVFLSKA